MKTLTSSALFLMLSLLTACGQQLVEITNPDDVDDNVAPVVTSTSPVHDATGIPVNAAIEATFSEAMSPETLSTATFTLTQGTIAVAGVVTYAGTTATFSPSRDLAASTTFTVTITTGATDIAGNALVANQLWSFTTDAAPDSLAPEVSSTSPTDLAVDVPVDTAIEAAFTKPMDPQTIISASFTLTDGVDPVTGTVVYDGPSNTATFTPANPLAFDTTYTVLVSASAKDLVGNALASGVAPNPWSFTTASTTEPLISVELGSAAPFGIAATAGITNTITAPISLINGDVVLDPLAECNSVAVDNAGGFGLCNGMAPTITGTVITSSYPDTTTAAAVKADLNAAFLAITPLAGPPAVGSLGGGTPMAAPTTLGNVAGSPFVLGDNWFTPGVYTSTTSILITGDITLDGQGDPNAVFVFQSASTLTSADGAQSPGAHARVLLINGAKASNVWWQVASSATIGSYSEFQGNILAAFDITMKTGATACGRSMAGAWVGGAGAFVLDANVVSVPGNGCPL